MTPKELYEMLIQYSETGQVKTWDADSRRYEIVTGVIFRTTNEFYLQTDGD